MILTAGRPKQGMKMLLLLYVERLWISDSPLVISRVSCRED